MPESSPEVDLSNYLGGWRLYSVIACLFFGQFLVALDTNIIIVAIPSISSQFSALQDVAWYGTAYILTLTAFQPLFGSIYKFFPPNAVYMISVLIFEVGSVLCAAAVNSQMFIAGRAAAGLGAAGVLQGALSIINQIIPLEKRALYTSVIMSVYVIASTAGPVLGGVFTQGASWRWCFWINLPIGVVVFTGLSVFLRFKGSHSKHRSLPLKVKLSSMDPLGCLLFVGSACSVLLALQWGGQSKPWKSADVLGCLIGGVILAIFFIFWQWKKQEEALITPRVFAQRSVWTAAMTLFFIGAQAYAVPFFLSFWFQGVRGASPVSTGVYFIARMVPQFVTLIFISVLVNKFGHYVPYIVTGELICIGGLVMLTQLKPDSSTLYWAASLVVTGIGGGMAMQLPYTAVAVALADEDIPIGNAIAVFSTQLGGALSISTGQTITLWTLLELVPERLPDVSVEKVIDAGGTGLTTLDISLTDLAVLRDIWNTGISRTMMLATAVVGAAVPFSLGMQWLNANKVAAARRQKIASASRQEIIMETQEAGNTTK